LTTGKVVRQVILRCVGGCLTTGKVVGQVTVRCRGVLDDWQGR